MNTELEAYYNTNEELVNRLLDTKVNNDKDSIESAMNLNFKSILSQCVTKSTAILTNSNQNILSKDSMEILALNPNLFLSYIKPKVSQELYSICSNLIKSPYNITMDKDGVINDDNLRPSEKIALLTYLPALQKKYTMKKLKTRGEESFLDSYDVAITICSAALGAKLVLIATMMGTVPEAAPQEDEMYVEAWAEYYFCIDEAAKKYHRYPYN
jgi:hypothetical protein